MSVFHELLQAQGMTRNHRKTTALGTGEPCDRQGLMRAPSVRNRNFVWPSK